MVYEDTNRGTFQFRSRAKQLVDFSGLRYGNITPTDVDGLMEWGNRTWIFFEFKKGDAEIPNGQKLALERTANILQRSGKNVFVVIARHHEEDPENDVKASDTIVDSCFYKGSWRDVQYMTLKTFLDWLWKKHKKQLGEEGE